MRTRRAARVMCVLFALVNTSMGCAGILAEPTAEAIAAQEGANCPVDDIRIEDAHVPFGGNAPARWWARCPGEAGGADRLFYCSQLHREIACSEAPPGFEPVSSTRSPK